MLGTKGAGKTTLLKNLGAKFEYEPNTSAQDIEEFTIERKDGSIIHIAKTKDIGGDKEYIKKYNEIVEKGCHIFFLINAFEVVPPKGVTKRNPKISFRLEELYKVIEQKQIEKKIKIVYLITHFDEFIKENKKSESYVEQYFRKHYKNQTEHTTVMVGNLRNDEFIDMIKYIIE